jgi:hypothetical protein
MSAASTTAGKVAGCGCGCSTGSTRNVVSDAAALYRRFNGFGALQAIKVKHRRLMPPVVVELGPLAGLIYRSNKGEPGRRLRTYIHAMEDPPRLVSNVEGTQLYIVGGSYRVGARGIEG